MGNLCSDEEEEEEPNFEIRLRRTLVQLKTLRERHLKQTTVETDVTRQWTKIYSRYIESIEELLRQVTLDKSLSQLPVTIDIDYQSHECPKVCEIEGINLPITPQ